MGSAPRAHSGHCSSSPPVSPPAALLLCTALPSASKQTVLSLPKQPLARPHSLSITVPPPCPLYRRGACRCHWNSSSQCPHAVHVTVPRVPGISSSYLTHRQHLEPDTAPPPFHWARVGDRPLSPSSALGPCPLPDHYSWQGPMPQTRDVFPSLLHSLPWRPGCCSSL